MAHFAELDQNNIVKQVIVVNNNSIKDQNGQEQEHIGVAFCQQLYGANTHWKQCSYNGNIRKNFAGVGFHYRADLDAFIAPQPYPSWLLDTATATWHAPLAQPQDGLIYRWDENQVNWVPVNGT